MQDIGPSTVKYVQKLSMRLNRSISAAAPKRIYTGSEGKVLSYLLDHINQDIYQKDIEQAFSIRSSSATQILKRMEKDGLIVRQKLPADARRRTIILTQKALAYRRQVNDNLNAMEKRLVKGINERDLNQLHRMLRIMIDNMGEN